MVDPKADRAAMKAVAKRLDDGRFVVLEADVRKLERRLQLPFMLTLMDTPQWRREPGLSGWVWRDQT